jgi:hypothetical protein
MRRAGLRADRSHSASQVGPTPGRRAVAPDGALAIESASNHREGGPSAVLPAEPGRADYDRAAPSRGNDQQQYPAKAAWNWPRCEPAPSNTAK